MKKTISILIFALFSIILFGQNENPFSQFGYEAPIMKEKTKIVNEFGVFKIINSDSTFYIGWLIIDVKNSLISFYSKSGELKAIDTISVSSIARWLTTDPANQYHSPYIGMGNNPINLTDPNGATTNPIYDWGGNFLGTDNLGLQGEAIVMNASNFTQGMAHADALNVGTLFSQLPMVIRPDILNNISNHFASLPSRPDFDGFITKSEADAWWQKGTGEALYVNMAQIDLPGVTTASFNQNGFYSENFIWGMSNTGQVYGTLDMTLLNPNIGDVRIGYRNPNVSPNGLVLDRYDFTYDGRLLRDFATWVGRPSGHGTAFDIHGYNTARVPIR